MTLESEYMPAFPDVKEVPGLYKRLLSIPEGQLGNKRTRRRLVVHAERQVGTLRASLERHERLSGFPVLTHVFGVLENDKVVSLSNTRFDHGSATTLEPPNFSEILQEINTASRNQRRMDRRLAQ